MILKHLSLHNYLVFEGLCELNLDGTLPPKNVIVVGGKNGAGKSTIVEAIRLCLYGAQGVGRRPGREYRTFLQSRINAKAAKASSYAKSFVELRFVHQSKSVLVRRSWTLANDDDTLYLEVDGKELNIERDYWPEFLKLLIPPGVAQFFIFDGEKIQEIAKEEKSDQTIVEGIKSLLGLDVFERLEADLEHYARQKLKSEASQATQADYKKADSELETAKQNLALCENDIEDVEEEISSFDAQKLELERRITKDFTATAQDRPKLQRERDLIDEQLKDLNTKFGELCGGLLPFSMLANLGIRLEDRLERERKINNWLAAKEATFPQAKKLVDRLFGDAAPKPEPHLTASQASFLSGLLLNSWESLFVPPPSDASGELILELPMTVESSVRVVLRESRGQVADELTELLDRRERLANRTRTIEMELQRIPPGDPDADLFRELSNVNATLGRLKERRAQLEDRAERSRTEVKDNQRRLGDIAEQFQLAEGARKQLELCKRIKLAIHDYLNECTGKRVSTLAKNVEYMLQKLVRKEDLVSRLEIDAKDFSVTLYGRDSTKLSKNDLSAGEKEIYAICLLWGLAQTSGRELPIVIDTPLSRLDSDHRKAIVQKYYPTAGVQVIILSTDTEVDKEYYQVLLPSIAKAFLLDYDSTDSRTRVAQGYFWS